MTEDELSPRQFASAFLRFLEEVNRNAPTAGPDLSARVLTHLDGDPRTLQVVAEELDPYEHPNLQLALEALVDEVDPGATWAGIAGDQKQYVTSVLAMILGRSSGPFGAAVAEGPVDRTSFRIARNESIACIQHGVLLASDHGSPFVVAVLGPSFRHGPRQQVHVEVVSGSPEHGRRLMERIRELMREKNVYRGKVIAVTPGRLDMGAQMMISFPEIPVVGRDDVVLPRELLERIVRHTISVSTHAEALLSAGRSLKRGMLFHGPPGTGKTMSLMYLIGQMPGRTVIVTSGSGYGLLPIVIQLARMLAPSMVVLEDVDLVAMDRTNPFQPGGGLLFELLNEMDGLQADQDVIFALTSNRPESLEPALAARPGRIDLAVEFPLPDHPARVRLIQVYSRGLSLEGVDLEVIAGELDGASPAYIKELLRRAAVIAAEEGSLPSVTGDHVGRAREELSSGGVLGERILGYRQAIQPGHDGDVAGFPDWHEGSVHPRIIPATE